MTGGVGGGGGRGGFPGDTSGKECPCQYRRRRRRKRRGFEPWVGKIPWRRAWQPTPVFLPGESHGQRSLAGCSSQGHTGLDTTEATGTCACSLRNRLWRSMALVRLLAPHRLSLAHFLVGGVHFPAPLTLVLALRLDTTIRT